MSSASVRCYAELNDHLAKERRMVPFEYAFDDRASVRDVIDAIGVPANEVDLVLVNGESVDFSSILNNGDRVSIFPVFESFDISPVTRVRSRALRQSRFVLDVHLGKLAAYLRMLGFDSLYRNTYLDEDLIQISKDEGRILLSKDRKLIEDSTVTRGYCVQSNEPDLQLVEVLRRFDLFRSTRPFQRCLRCNAVLQPIQKNAIVHRLPPKVSQFFEEFQLCDVCDRIYWKGSHFDRMQGFIRKVLGEEAHR